MRNLEQNERDIQKLEEQIRKLGTPYASNEPEPLYWANFRVRVMEQITEKEKKSAWTARFVEFIADHIMGTSIAAAAACLLVAGIIAMQPSGGEAPQLAAIPAPAQTAPLAAPNVQTASPATQSAHPAHPSYQTHPTNLSDKTDMAKAAQHPAQPADDLAAVAEPFAASPSEQAVSLESLSQPELEAVLQGLQSNE